MGPLMHKNVAKLLFVVAFGAASGRPLTWRNIEGWAQLVDPPRRLQTNVKSNATNVSAGTTVPPPPKGSGGPNSTTMMPGSGGPNASTPKATSFVFGVSPLFYNTSQLPAPSFFYLYQSFAPALMDDSSGAAACFDNGTTPCLVPQWSAPQGGSYVATNYSVVCSVNGRCQCSAGSTPCNGTAPLVDPLQFAAVCVPEAVTTCPVSCQWPCVSYKYDDHGHPLGEHDDHGHPRGGNDVSSYANMTCGSCSCDPMMETQCTIDGRPQCLPKAHFSGCPNASTTMMPGSWDSNASTTEMEMEPGTSEEDTTGMPPGTPFVFGVSPLVFLTSQLPAPSFFYLYQNFGPALMDPSSGASACYDNGTTPCLVPQWGAPQGGGYVATKYSVVCSVNGKCQCSAGSKTCNGTAPLQDPPTFAAVCVPEAVTTCPASCQWPCISFKYDDFGYSLGNDVSNYANMTCGSCSCNPMREMQCTVDGRPQCLPQVFGACPLSCGANATACLAMGFDSGGYPTYNQSCVANLTDGMCPEPTCDKATADLCMGSYGYDYCAPKGQCPPPPVTCNVDQQLCFGLNASTAGTIMDTGTCMSASMSCPCRSDQKNCTSSDGSYTFCSDYFCPVYCADGQQLCFGQNESTAYTPLDVGVCMDASVPCPCRADQFNCTSSDGSYSYCSDYTCPVYCADGQQLCFGLNASTAYTALDTGVCMDASVPCPCGEGQSTCNAFGMTYCSSDGCPVDCGDPAVNQTCTVFNYLPDGEMDWNSLDDLKCVPVSSPCPCGNNSISCTLDGYSFCSPSVISGVKTTCPVDCTDSQQSCYVVDYDKSGNMTGSRQSCVAASATCPCGSNTNTCFDEFNSSYCLPAVTACPTVCNARTQDTCNIPTYDNAGNVNGVSTQCVPSGQNCPCPDTVQVGAAQVPTNAKPCNHTLDDGSVYTDCMATAFYNLCPSAVQCPSNTPYTCPSAEIFDSTGSFVKMGSPYCARNSDACGCGDPLSPSTTKWATNCTISNQTFCFPKVDPVTSAPFACPVDCPDDRPQRCDVADYDANGVVTGQSQTCVGPKDKCPCGKNADRQPGGTACLSKVALKALDPGCDDSKYPCFVEDFDATTGASLGKTQQCQLKGQDCPCGKGAYDKAQGGPCKDGNSTVCISKVHFGRYGCPTPCTHQDEKRGKSTCVQTHLDKSGNYVATSVNCVNGTDACEPGQNQKKCPSGAMIFTGAVCQDIYGAAGNSTVGLPSGTSQTAQLVMSLTAGQGGITGAAAGKAANNVQASLGSVLQLGSDVQLDVTFVTVGANGKAGRRLQSASTVQAVVSVASTGKAAVAPDVIMSKAKSMGSSGSDSFTKAFAAVGVPNTKAGFSTSSVTKSTAPVAPVAVTVNSTSNAGQTTTPNPMVAPAPTPVVTGTISVGGFATAADVQSFAAKAAPLLASAICSQLGLPASNCAVSLSSTAARRLLDQRRRLAFSAIFGYTVTVPPGVSTVSVVASMASSSQQAAIWTAFTTQAAASGVTVPAGASPTWSAPVAGTAQTPTGGAPAPAPGAGATETTTVASAVATTLTGKGLTGLTKTSSGGRASPAVLLSLALAVSLKMM